ncbi:MAG: CDP-alcohol phosphatidyltransferase family protein [Nitrospirae bacterium]|nr:CDP-alcohol phosphatidyltransferase family protein [Nitrospirota bacterium]
MSSTVHPEIKAQALDTAVLLTTAGLFSGMLNRAGGERQPEVGPQVGPLTRVGGLSLFQRAVLTLQRAGMTQLLVLAGDEEEVLRRALLEDPRITMTVRWMPVREFPPDDPRTWDALAGELRGACLVVGAQTVFSRGLVERLRAEAQDGQTVFVVSRTADGGRSGDSVNPAVEIRADRRIALRDRPPDGLGSNTNYDGIAADMIVLPASLLRAAGTGGSRAEESLRLTPLRGFIEQAASQGLVRVIPVSPHWYWDVRGLDGVKMAERTLLQSLKKEELEGFVDRHFNRKVSGALTRLFLRAGFSPNAITVLSMIIGLLAAASFAWGSYAAGILGALLFQLSAIVDCCDGEVARLTFTESRFGEQLDITADNIVHMAIFAGVAWAVFLRQGGWEGASAIPWLPLALGAAGMVAIGLSQWLVNRARALCDRGAWANPAQAVRAEFILKNMASRDFSVVLLLFALFGGLQWFLWLAAIGSNAFWVMMAWVLRPAMKTRA